MRLGILLLAGLLIISGCAAQSISDTGYSSSKDSRKSANNFSEPVSKELDEQAVLGLAQVGAINEVVIRETLAKSTGVAIPKDSSILLVQSGAEYPDSEMVQAMSQFWNVNIFSGDSREYEKQGLHQKLRYIAATGGNSHLVVVWGIVETAEQNLATKNISWVPLVGWSLPDEQKNIRISLKIAVIDVASGDWRMFNPKALEDEYFSSLMNRAGEDQQMVIEMKKKVYQEAAKELYNKFKK